MAAFEVFDFEEQTWRKLPDIPSKRVFALYVASDKHIYSIGGLNQNPKDGFSDATEAFDLEKGMAQGSMLNPERQKIHFGLLTQQCVFDRFMKGCQNQPPSIKHDL